MDPVEVRRRNLIPPDAFPYTTPTGPTYDTRRLRAAPWTWSLGHAGYDELRAEQARRRAAGDPMAARHRPGHLRRDHRGRLAARSTARSSCGPTASGPGPHRHVAPRAGPRHLVGDARRRPPRHRPRAASTWCTATPTSCPDGGITGGSRSVQIGRHRRVAAPPATLVERARRSWPPTCSRRARTTWCSTGPPAASTWPARRPSPCRGAGWPRPPPPRAARCRVEATSPADGATFPFGAHVAVVEVDTETGQVTLLRLVAVDDAGRILNPLLAEGQVHGGIAQGVAQALFEEVRLRRRRQPAHHHLRRLRRSISAAELPSFERLDHRDADARQRRSGPRASASRAPSAPPPPCRTPWSTPSPTSESATSTCRPRPSGCGGPSFLLSPSRSWWSVKLLQSS